MRTFILVLALAAATAIPASAAWTPEGTRCVTSLGYTTADWEAYRVPPGPAQKVRACFARMKAKRGQ